jgi:cytochrome c5
MRNGRIGWTAAALGLALSAACAGAPTPLPEAASDDAGLYRTRCGACHSVPHPGRHTPAEWGRMLKLMEVRMADAGMAPLEGPERARILDYLTRHAR